MYCPKCGAIIEDNVNFCSTCGYKLSNIKKELNIDENSSQNSNGPLNIVLRVIQFVGGLLLGLIILLALFGMFDLG